MEAKEVRELKKMAQSGDIQAMKALAGMHACLSVQYLKWNSKAGELGDVEAQENAAFYYRAQRMRKNQTAESRMENLRQEKIWFEKMLRNPQISEQEKINIQKDIRELDELLNE